jgi:glycosyltransferase involved in cell wall biosynthesis
VLINPDPSKGGEIAMAIAEHRQDVQFIFQECWPTDERIPPLKARARRAGNVSWRIPVADIRSVFAQTRVLLVPSQWEEVWGRVVSEAHVSGIPVLASRIGGLSESVGPGGVLVDPGAPLERWLDAFSSVWDDRENWQLLSLAARKYAVREGFSVEYLAKKMVDILLRV